MRQAVDRRLSGCSLSLPAERLTVLRTLLTRYPVPWAGGGLWVEAMPRTLALALPLPQLRQGLPGVQQGGEQGFVFWHGAGPEVSPPWPLGCCENGGGCPQADWWKDAGGSWAARACTRMGQSTDALQAV